MLCFCCVCIGQQARDRDRERERERQRDTGKVSRQKISHDVESEEEVHSHTSHYKIVKQLKLCYKWIFVVTTDCGRKATPKRETEACPYQVHLYTHKSVWLWYENNVVVF